MTTETLRITREFNAPRQRVFDAFIQPEALQQWFGPGGFTVPRCEVDARPGGRYQIQLHTPDGEVNIVGGEFREITPPEKLVFTWAWLKGDQPGTQTLVTLTFAERAGKTELTLLQTGFDTAHDREMHGKGWDASLDCLVDALAGKPQPTTARPLVLGDPRSTHVRSVRMAFVEKGIAYELEPHAPHSPAIDAVHPFGRIPALKNGSTTLFETSAILRYVDEAFPGPKLMPETPAQRAAVEQWISATKHYVYDTMVRRYVLQYVVPRNDGKPDRATIDAALPEIRTQLGILDTTYGKRDFLVGDTLSLADLVLAPIMAYLPQMPEGKALLQPYANLWRAHERLTRRESFKATQPPTM
jgi:glutathione S-transferase